MSSVHDHELEEVSDNVRVHTIDHEPWTMPTLKRYNYFMKEKDFILEHDYCFYFDVDMDVSQVVGDEILGDLVASNHFYQSHVSDAQKSFDRIAVRLLMFLTRRRQGLVVRGGFNGGKTEFFYEYG